ncbi:MAG TPA: glycine--tRNA ligase subunit beta [Rhizomicrobium sp.]|nr:glycine--tRNA ligase subunit beta [Rhizomicrobium sp.]
MADLLLELFSEEIPARMQAQAAKDLERIVVGALSDRGLMFEGAKTFAGPRRLTLALVGLPSKQPDVSEEKKGPRVNAAAKAIDGFLRSAGVTLEQCETRDDGKGAFYVAVVQRKGRATADVLAEILPECFAKLPWPKSMRWPQSTNAPVRWVRPLHAILCTLDGDVVPFVFAGVASGNRTRGHRFLSNGEIEARRYDDYVRKSRDAFVIVDAEERKDIVLHEVKNKAFALGLEPIADEGLLDEVAGLAEWPVVLIGTIENQFMDVPAEILQTSMRTHQKYFSLRDPKTGQFANRFAVVANMAAADGGKTVVAGNERVLRARLSDAKFFWDQDRKTPLANRVAALAEIVFHAKAGSMLDRAHRVALIAMLLADLLKGDIEKAKRAGLLAKADLTSGVVGEFPELQGVMGRYYALHDGETPEVADAVRDHYRPLGPSDQVPTAAVSVTVALADKIDSLVTLWHAGEKPTGSKDPFALRRSALGIIRILLENKIRLNLLVPIFAALELGDGQRERRFVDRLDGALSNAILVKGIADDLLRAARTRTASAGGNTTAAEVMDFFADRLKVALREQGVRHDLIDAVFSLGGEDDIVRLVTRVTALQQFLKTEDGTNLLAGYKRAANILRIEEKKDGRSYPGEPDPALLSLPEEKTLFMDMAAGRELIAAELERERFAEAMSAMAKLRGPVDAFFDKVTVNAPDAALRTNRLQLLARLRETLHTVADYSKIEG